MSVPTIEPIQIKNVKEAPSIYRYVKNDRKMSMKISMDNEFLLDFLTLNGSLKFMLNLLFAGMLFARLTSFASSNPAGLSGE